MQTLDTTNRPGDTLNGLYAGCEANDTMSEFPALVAASGAAILHNYTPHKITLVGDDLAEVTLPSEGVARVAQTPGAQTARILIGGNGTAYGYIAVHAPSQYGAVDGLPLPNPGHYYIVSMMVAQAAPERTDLLIPGTGPADNPIRENGQVVGVTRLIANAAPPPPPPLYAQWSNDEMARLARGEF